MGKVPFTEKEDETILQLFKDNRGVVISHVVQKISTLTGRGISAIYGRYYDKYKYQLKE
jgi:hypothetical protein